MKKKNQLSRHNDQIRFYAVNKRSLKRINQIDLCNIQIFNFEIVKNLSTYLYFKIPFDHELTTFHPRFFESQLRMSNIISFEDHNKNKLTEMAIKLRSSNIHGSQLTPIFVEMKILRCKPQKELDQKENNSQICH